MPISIYPFISAYFILLFTSCKPPVKSKNQYSVDDGGSYLVAAICAEGIVVGADSRAAFHDGNKQISAYTEGALKIFEHNSVFIAMAGGYTFDQQRFPGLFKSFRSTSPGTLPVSKFHEIFFSFARVKLSSASYENLKRNQFIICGYENNIPTVLYYSDDLTSKITSPGYITNQEGFPVNEKFKNTLKTADLTVAANAVENMIKRMAKSTNKTAVSHIGGPPSIVTITPLKNTWIKKQTKFAYDNIKDFAADYKKGKVKIIYRSKQDSISLRDGFTYAGY